MFPDLTEYFNNPNANARKSVDYARRSIDLGPRRSIDLGARKSIDFGRRKSSFALYQPFTPSIDPNFNFDGSELELDDKRQNLPPGQRRHSSITAYLLGAYDMINNQ